jgi:CO dehydrogenase/acetyl-CoA synthase gamma subunit (corrinoid Fe-S protein)
MNNEYHEAYKFPDIRCGRCSYDGCLEFLHRVVSFACSSNSEHITATIFSVTEMSQVNAEMMQW